MRTAKGKEGEQVSIRVTSDARNKKERGKKQTSSIPLFS
jgi:hypothetical protein